VGAVVNLHFTEQDYRHPRTFPLLDICTHGLEQGLDVPPLDIGGRWVREDRGKGLGVLSFHRGIVSINDTIGNRAPARFD